MTLQRTHREHLLVVRLSKLNPDAGEIGEGMLKSLVEEARSILGLESMPAFSGLCGEIDQQGNPVPPVDLRPVNCRERLRSEGKPYPKSGCQVCGSIIQKGWSCRYV